MSFVITSPLAPHVAPKDVPDLDDAPVASRSVLTRVLGHALLLVLSFVSVFPVYWMFATALRDPGDALSQRLIPWPLSLENFAYVQRTIPIVGMMGRTLLMATAIAVAQLVVAVLAAYAFAVFEFRFKKLLFLLFIGSWLVPFQVTMIPNYLLVSKLGLLNTVVGVVVPQMCSAFAVLMMRQHLLAFPRDLIDAAHMEGQNSLGTLLRVVLPNMRPALAAVSIMLFISAWNEYLWPSLILQKQQYGLIQVGIRSFLGAEGNNWGAVMAASALACVPVLLIYLFFRRYVVDAFVRSGLK